LDTLFEHRNAQSKSGVCGTTGDCKPVSSQMKKFYFYALGAIVVFSAISYGGWYFERWVHYKLSYQSLVKEEIRAMVKENCLQ
jgi:hypothetical protein